MDGFFVCLFVRVFVCSFISSSKIDRCTTCNLGESLFAKTLVIDVIIIMMITVHVWTYVSPEKKSSLRNDKINKAMWLMTINDTV